MSDQNENEELKGYYVIKFEKFLDLMEDIEHKYQITADILHDRILGTLPEFWEGTDIPDIIEFFANINDIRKFLEDKINNATDEEIKLASKYDIKDVLIRSDELKRMNTLLLAEQELEAGLEINHKIVITTHWQAVNNDYSIDIDGAPSIFKRRKYMSAFESEMRNILKAGIYNIPVYSQTASSNYFFTTNEDNYILEVPMVGITKENLSIVIEDNRLTVSAKADDKVSYYAREFKQTWYIPKDANVDELAAKLEYGVLRLTVGRVKPVKKVVNVAVA